MSETDTLRACIQYLEFKKNKNELMYWRNNTGAVIGEYKGKKTFRRYGAIGSPDIFVLQDGELIGIEVKFGKNKQRPEQKLFEHEMEKNGGRYLLIYSVDELVLRI